MFKNLAPPVRTNRQMLFIAHARAADAAADDDFFPTFDGRVVFRPTANFTLAVGHGAVEYFKEGADNATKAYVEAIYGYGTSSFPERNTPAAVIYAKHENDIITAVNYASTIGVSLAIRSGGHQYGAFCSATKRNIVLDLSDPQADFNKGPVYNENDNTWTVGAGVKLETLIDVLRERGAFVPHGECTWVCCGGHLHTGGYSPFFSRSFGMFVDHVTKFTIVLAPSTKTNFQAQAKTVKKPVKNNPSDDDDLWYSVMGGSAGSFGVVLDMTIIPRFDKDHKGARALTHYERYNKAGFKRCIEILAEYSQKDNLPADFCINVFMLSSRDNETETRQGRQNLDTCMRDNRPDIYGEKPQAVMPAFALLVNWNNVSGVGFNETNEDGYNASQIFESIRNRLDASPAFMASTLNTLGIRPDQKTVGGRLTEIFTLQGDKAMNISDLDRILGFPARVEANPYVGTDRLYLPTDGGLSETNFVEGTVNTLDDAHNEVDCWPTPQWGITGGKHSQISKTNAANPSIALAQREAALNCIYYVHYDNVKKGGDDGGPAKAAKQNVETMEKVLVEAFGGDHRWLAFCGQDETLEDLWQHYFDSKEDFDRVKRVKKEYDPNNIFTPHKYGVSSD